MSDEYIRTYVGRADTGRTVDNSAILNVAAGADEYPVDVAAQDAQPYQTDACEPIETAPMICAVGAIKALSEITGLLPSNSNKNFGNSSINSPFPAFTRQP